MEESQERKKEEQEGKESPFGSHEILRLATDPGETMEAESILRADGHRCLADWHRSDRSIWRSRSSGSREIARPRKSRPPPFFRSSSSRKPLTLVLGLVQFVAFPGPAVFRCLREGKNEVRRPSSFSKNTRSKYPWKIETEETRAARAKCYWKLFESCDTRWHLVSDVFAFRVSLSLYRRDEDVHIVYGCMKIRKDGKWDRERDSDRFDLDRDEAD